MACGSVEGREVAIAVPETQELLTWMLLLGYSWWCQHSTMEDSSSQDVKMTTKWTEPISQNMNFGLVYCCIGCFWPLFFEYYLMMSSLLESRCSSSICWSFLTFQSSNSTYIQFLEERLPNQIYMWSLQRPQRGVPGDERHFNSIGSRSKWEFGNWCLAVWTRENIMRISDEDRRFDNNEFQFDNKSSWQRSGRWQTCDRCILDWYFCKKQIVIRTTLVNFESASLTKSWKRTVSLLDDLFDKNSCVTWELFYRCGM